MSIIFRNIPDVSGVKFNNNAKKRKSVKRIVLDNFKRVGGEAAAFSDFKLIINSNGDLFDTGDLIYVSTRGGSEYPNPRLETTTLSMQGTVIYPHTGHYRFDYAIETTNFNPPNAPGYRYIILGTIPIESPTNYTGSVIDITYNEPTDAYGFKLKPYVDSRGRFINGLRYTLYDEAGNVLEQKEVGFVLPAVNQFITEPIIFDISSK